MLAADDGLTETARRRREQIIDAAEEIIAHHGIANLSLKRIESRAGMSRGHLTYYFPTKESILLAVFDRMLRRMILERLQSSRPPQPMTGRAWDCFREAIREHLGLGEQPLESRRDLFSLLYTFLAQMGHREDDRQKLVMTYPNWRKHIAADVAASTPEPRPVAPAIVASLIQALIHGLTVQLMVDPQAFDRQEMAAACEWIFAPLFQKLPEVEPAANRPAGINTRSEGRT